MPGPRHFLQALCRPVKVFSVVHVSGSPAGSKGRIGRGAQELADVACVYRRGSFESASCTSSMLGYPTLVRNTLGVRDVMCRKKQCKVMTEASVCLGVYIC